MANSGLGAKRKGKATSEVSLEGMKRRCRSFFLDSGAHSLLNVIERIFLPKDKRHEWYSQNGKDLSKEFYEYLELYASFIHKYSKGMDYYATVDVIYSPELSWKSYKFLVNECGINPVPVIHNNTALKWVEKYIEAGCEFIGLGGLGQVSMKAHYYDWADGVYNMLCDNPDRLPCVRTHGFAMTSFELLCRYPWWSVDSSSAYKSAGNGSIFVPHKRNGKFIFDLRNKDNYPYVMNVSHRSSAIVKGGRHLVKMTKSERSILSEWLKEIDVPLGAMGDNNEVSEYGVVSEYNARALANLRYFQRVCDALPEWPWAFNRKPKNGFFPKEAIK
jgi:hypothetical protein